MLLFSSLSATEVLKHPDVVAGEDYKQAEASLGSSICHIHGCSGQHTDQNCA